MARDGERSDSFTLRAADIGDPARISPASSPPTTRAVMAGSTATLCREGGIHAKRPPEEKGAFRIANVDRCQYLGLAMAAKTTLPQPGLQRRWTALDGEDVSDGGDPYTGYDRFSRTQRSLWLKDTGTELEPLVDVAWGYDQASLRTWRRDRSPGAPAEHQDQAFSYDELYQLTQRQRGNLNFNQTSVNGYAQAAEDFDYDTQGNWNTYQTKEDGQPVIDQSRTHNESNQPSDRIGSEIASPALGAARRAGVAMPCNFRQITKIDGTSAIIAHDKNGNTVLVPTSDPNGPQGNLEGEPVRVIWDAWNRLRKVFDETDQLIQENHYDALTRRIITDDGNTPRHYYYNDQWRCVEERLGTSTDPERQYIWNPQNRWDLILRDRDTSSNGTLDEHLWCLKDDLDPVAIADHTGAIVERYAFSAFGMSSILTPAFQPRSDNQSEFDWNFLFHAEFADDVTGWMNYGYRFYVPMLGRWLARDPLQERGGVNLYRFVLNSPLGWLDFLGEAPVDGLTLDELVDLYGPFEPQTPHRPDRNLCTGGYHSGPLSESAKRLIQERIERGKSNDNCCDGKEYDPVIYCCFKDKELHSYSGALGNHV